MQQLRQYYIGQKIGERMQPSKKSRTARECTKCTGVLLMLIAIAKENYFPKIIEEKQKYKIMTSNGFINIHSYIAETVETPI